MNKAKNWLRLAMAGALVVAALGAGRPVVAGPIDIMGAGTNDFNGDGRADMTALYDYGNGAAGLFVFPGTARIEDGATQAYRVWYTPPGNFWSSVSKITSGDFNGDGYNDVLAMYDYGNGSAGLWVFPGTANRGDGSTNPYMVWYTPPGNFWLGVAKITSGDFNDDGKADLLAMYDYGNASAGLWVFPGTTGSGGNASNPYMVWYTPPGNFLVNSAKIASGDFNLDGRDDLVALYDYGNAEAALWVFPGVTGSGGNASNPYEVWEVGPGNFDVNAVRAVDTDDLNGDGIVDFIAVRDDAVFRFSGTTGSGTNATQWGVYSGGGNAKFVVGDYDGNGYADILALVDHGGGSSSLWVMSGNLPANQTKYWVRVWFTGPGNFWPSVVKVA